MTNTDKKAFVQAFNVLAVAARLPAHEADASMQRVYFDGLRDLEIAAVSAAAVELAKTAQWFPRVAEWRAAAKLQHVELLKALPSGREEPWHDECGACLDTGWEERRCYPGTANNCGRTKCMTAGTKRAEHKYMSACSCRPTNRTYQRHHLGSRGTYATDHA